MLNNDQFNTSLGLVQNALTELLSSHEHIQHPEDCAIVNCSVRPAREMLDRYIAAKNMMVEIPAFYLIKLHDVLSDLTMATDDRLARYRAACVCFNTRLAYRRAIAVSTEVVEQMAAEQHGARTGRVSGKRSSLKQFGRTLFAGPMAVRVEPEGGCSDD